MWLPREYGKFRRGIEDEQNSLESQGGELTLASATEESERRTAGVQGRQKDLQEIFCGTKVPSTRSDTDQSVQGQQRPLTWLIAGIHRRTSCGIP